MKGGRAEICIFQKMRIKNLRRGTSEVRLKKLDSFMKAFTLKTSKTASPATFCVTGA